MNISTSEKIDQIKSHLLEVDIFSTEFESEIKDISEKHKIHGGHIEYSYITHFSKEIIGLSKLLQYLLDDPNNKKYSFFVVRSSIEILLHLEHVIRLAKEDDKKVLSLLSKDMAQSVASIDLAIPTDKNHSMHKTIAKVNLVNKILKTDFNLEKIKSNTRIFPDIKSLCTQSKLRIKDSIGIDMYHVYAMYSESNHLRLGSPHSITEDQDILDCSALEYFIEIYIKFYQQILDTNIFSKDYKNKLDSIKGQLGLTW